MAKAHKAIVYLSDPYECTVEVTYEWHRGYPATLETPEEPAYYEVYDAEIIEYCADPDDIRVFIDSEELLETCQRHFVALSDSEWGENGYVDAMYR